MSGAQKELGDRIAAAARLTGRPQFVLVEHGESGTARVVLVEDIGTGDRRERAAELRKALGENGPALSVRVLAPAEVADRRYRHEYELMRQVGASNVVYDREGEALNEGPRPGIRKRRQEAACRVIAEAGWRRVGEGDAGEFRRYRKDRRTLIAGPGGALYWSAGGATIERKARRADGAEIAAALDAARAAGQE